MSLGFSSTVRLHSRPEFTAVQEQGRRVATRYFTMLGLVNARSCDRLGVIASRRFGGAVARNRAKRRLRELFRLTSPHREAASPMDLVVIPRRELLNAPFSLVRDDFARGLARLRAGSRA
jgi:ribonuclease P protein component